MKSPFSYGFPMVFVILCFVTTCFVTLSINSYKVVNPLHSIDRLPGWAVDISPMVNPTCQTISSCYILGKPMEDYHWLFHGNIMEYGDEKWHLNQFLGQDWIESMVMQQEPMKLGGPTMYKAYLLGHVREYPHKLPLKQTN